MAKRKSVVNKVVVDKNAAQFMRTAANLAKKGKTNKKLHGRNANPKAAKYAIQCELGDLVIFQGGYPKYRPQFLFNKGLVRSHKMRMNLAITQV